MPKNHPLPKARVERIMQDAARTGSRELPRTLRLWRNHGSLCMSRKGFGAGNISQELVVSHINPDNSYNEVVAELSRCLQHADPMTLEELARGYMLALDAGLLSEHDARSQDRRDELTLDLAKSPELLRKFDDILCREGVVTKDHRAMTLFHLIREIINHPKVRANG